MFLLGRQAMFGHDPPMYLRSITATRCPCSARVQPVSFDPAPLPRTTRSYSSGSGFLGNCAEETFSILLFSILFLSELPFLERSQYALAESVEGDALITSCFSK